MSLKISSSNSIRQKTSISNLDDSLSSDIITLKTILIASLFVVCLTFLGLTVYRNYIEFFCSDSFCSWTKPPPFDPNHLLISYISDIWKLWERKRLCSRIRRIHILIHIWTYWIFKSLKELKSSLIWDKFRIMKLKKIAELKNKPTRSKQAWN
jgi:hypothetical protein